MKTLLALLSALMVAAMMVSAGCTSTVIETPTWQMLRVSLFQRPEISEVSATSNGTVKVAGYRNGQDLSPVIEAAIQAGIQGALKATNPVAP